MARSSTPHGREARVVHVRWDGGMRPLRYSINVTLDGCCGHRAIPGDDELHRHAAETPG